MKAQEIKQDVVRLHITLQRATAVLLSTVRRFATGDAKAVEMRAAAKYFMNAEQELAQFHRIKPVNSEFVP